MERLAETREEIWEHLLDAKIPAYTIPLKIRMGHSYVDINTCGEYTWRLQVTDMLLLAFLFSTKTQLVFASSWDGTTYAVVKNRVKVGSGQTSLYKTELKEIMIRFLRSEYADQFKAVVWNT